MILESVSPTVFVLLIRNFNFVLEVGAISFALGSSRDLPMSKEMSPPQHCVVVGVRLDPDAEDLSYTLCPILL